MNAVAVAIEADERRARRDTYREAGGSKRRPLHSFMTEREKREARDAHAARLRLAVEQLDSEAGFSAWIEAMHLNPHLTPMNAALVALQSPGEILDTAAGWRKQGYRIRKGERSAGRITGRGFWPLAYFTAEQANAGDLALFEPDLPKPSKLSSWRSDLSRRLARGERARLALTAVAECAR